GEWNVREIDNQGAVIRVEKPESQPQVLNEDIQRQMARRMLADGLPIETIIKYTGLSEEEVRKL
ncbi:MAG: hypothetical protein ACM3SY_00135, partial [Candidatus Omnitrophota bacterium]